LSVFDVVARGLCLSSPIAAQYSSRSSSTAAQRRDGRASAVFGVAQGPCGYGAHDRPSANSRHQLHSNELPQIQPGGGARADCQKAHTARGRLSRELLVLELGPLSSLGRHTQGMGYQQKRSCAPAVRAILEPHWHVVEGSAMVGMEHLLQRY